MTFHKTLQADELLFILMTILIIILRFKGYMFFF